MDIHKLAFPGAGFSWHKVEMARNALEIRDQAQLTGKDKALAVSQAALRVGSPGTPSEHKSPTPLGYQTAFYAVGGAPGLLERGLNAVRDRWFGHR